MKNLWLTKAAPTGRLPLPSNSLCQVTMKMRIRQFFRKCRRSEALTILRKTMDTAPTGKPCQRRCQNHCSSQQGLLEVSDFFCMSKGTVGGCILCCLSALLVAEVSLRRPLVVMSGWGKGQFN